MNHYFDLLLVLLLHWVEWICIRIKNSFCGQKNYFCPQKENSIVSFYALIRTIPYTSAFT